MNNSCHLSHCGHRAAKDFVFSHSLPIYSLQIGNFLSLFCGSVSSGWFIEVIASNAEMTRSCGTCEKSVVIYLKVFFARIF
jgi:hypothetical protein